MSIPRSRDGHSHCRMYMRIHIPFAHRPRTPERQTEQPHAQAIATLVAITGQPRWCVLKRRT